MIAVLYFRVNINPPDLNLLDNRYCSLQSTIMGCQITVSFPVKSPTLELSESILAILEGFFATVILERMYVLERVLKIEISLDSDDDVFISHEIVKSESNLKIEVACNSFSLDNLKDDGQSYIHDWLHRFAIEVFTYLFQSNDILETFKNIIGDDRALDRAISFGTSFTSQKSILGNDGITEVKDRICQSDPNSYELKRTKPWDEGNPKPELEKAKFFDGNIDKTENNTLDLERVSHDDFEVKGLIKIRLWGDAGWKGVNYSLCPDGIPELSLMFENESKAFAIFNGFKNELGLNDTNNRLNITIIRNISVKNPFHYRICVSENISFTDKKLIQMTARVNTMEPVNEVNLNNFLKSYKSNGFYWFSIVSNGNFSAFDRNSKIKISTIRVVEAWEIGPNDPAIIAILPDDDPIIPDGIKDAPIIKAMQRKF